MEKTVKLKQMTEKMVDYKRFAIVLLAVGVFFYLGVIIPTENKTQVYNEVMMAMTAILLSSSIFFFTKSKKYQQKINQIDNDNK